MPTKILLSARDLITNPSRWNQTHMAMDEDGTPCKPTDPRAICFDMEGAMRRVTNNATAEHSKEAYQRLWVAAGICSLWEYNDSRTHEQIINTFNKAIQMNTKKLYYAGIGSRQTDQETLEMMHSIGYILAERGWVLRSGHADGADAAFENGCDENQGTKEIYIPWNGFNGGYHDGFKIMVVHSMDKHIEALKIAKETHPAWTKCSPGAQLLHTRNIFQIAGQDLNTPVSMVVCWTPGGKRGGGTGQALRLAEQLDIPIFDLALPGSVEALEDYVAKAESNL